MLRVTGLCRGPAVPSEGLPPVAGMRRRPVPCHWCRPVASHMLLTHTGVLPHVTSMGQQPAACHWFVPMACHLPVVRASSLSLACTGGLQSVTSTCWWLAACRRLTPATCCLSPHAPAYCCLSPVRAGSLPQSQVQDGGLPPVTGMCRWTAACHRCVMVASHLSGTFTRVLSPVTLS